VIVPLHLSRLFSELLSLHLADHRHERRDEEGRYAGVRRETLLNGVCHSVLYYWQHNYRETMLQTKVKSKTAT